MPRASVEDPLKVFRFKVEFSADTGIAPPTVGFSEVSGLEFETDSVEYREGGDNETPKKSAGLTKYSDITLKRGQIDPTATLGSVNADFFVEWAAAVHRVSSSGTVANYRQTVTISQFNSENKLARSWKVVEAWPKKVKLMSDMNGTTSENSIEEMVLVHEGVEKIQ